MPKTRQEWKELDALSPKELTPRLGGLCRSIEQVRAKDVDVCSETCEELAGYTDECVYILLSLLKAVIKEEEWNDVTPMSLFTGVYSGLLYEWGWVWAAVLLRFLDTKKLVSDYREGSSSTRHFVRPKLVSRGFI